MNYCKQISYSYYKTSQADFDTMLQALLNQLPTDKLILRLVCWCNPSDNEEYEQWLSLSRRRVREYFTDCVPGFSLVAQPPLDCGMVLEVHSFRSSGGDSVYYKKFEKHAYVLVENAVGRFLFASGLHGSGLLSSAQEQADKAFQQLGALLEAEEFKPSSIVRQWNYLERITGMDGDDQRYQSFNNSRAAFYATDTWTDGYPAATGIGASLGGVCIDFDAVCLKNDSCKITPIDNRLQVAAHAYSADVIETSGHKKDSPKFERAKSLEIGNAKMIYISGTAAIRGEESLEGVGLARQLQVTLENIHQLTDHLPLNHLRVYLKDPSYYEEASRLLSANLPDVSVSFFHADVCRDALLVEIEGIAGCQPVDSQKKKMVVTGSEGFLGVRVCSYYADKYEVVGLSHSDLDISDEHLVMEKLSALSPDVVIHCAAISDTGYSQQHPDESEKVNVRGTVNVAEACRQCGAKLVFMSSDQVYNGNAEQGLLPETIHLHPVSVYGKHKLEAEQRVFQILPGAVGLRLTWMYDLPVSTLKLNRNILVNLLNAYRQHEKVRVATREFRGITSVWDVVKRLECCIGLPGGAYNFGCENLHTSFETFREAGRLMGFPDLSWIEADEERFPEHPRNLSMSLNKLRMYGIDFPNVFDGLEQSLNSFESTHNSL